MSIPWQNEVGTILQVGQALGGVSLGPPLTAICSWVDGGDRVLPGTQCLWAGWVSSPRPGLEGPATCTPQEGIAAQALQSPSKSCQCLTCAPSMFHRGWEAEPVPAYTGNRHPPALSVVPKVPHSCLSPTPGWSHGLFSLSRGEQCGLLMGWPCCPTVGSPRQPFHDRGEM